MLTLKLLAITSVMAEGDEMMIMVVISSLRLGDFLLQIFWRFVPGVFSWRLDAELQHLKIIPTTSH